MRIWFALCLLVGVVGAFDDALDFSKQKLKEQQKEQPQDSKASQAVNLAHTHNPISWEFGVGYVYSGFKARQDGSVDANHSTSTNSNGVDIFLNANMYLSQKGGVTLGVGLEFLPLAWQSSLYEYATNGLAPVKENDFLVSEYLSLGGFYNVYQGVNSAVRIFANAGIGLNFLFGGSYNGNVVRGYYVDFFNPAMKIPITLPIMLGARYSFKSHGIEAVLKANVLNLDYAIEGYATPYTTSISRGIGFGLRYVYEFK